MYRHPPTITCFVVLSLLQWDKSDYASDSNRFCKAGFSPVWCCCHKGNMKHARCTSTKIHLHPYIGTAASQLWEHPTRLSDCGSSTFPLLKHGCPQFLYAQGQNCSSIPLLRTSVNMRGVSSRDHAIPRVHLFLSLSPFDFTLSRTAKSARSFSCSSPSLNALNPGI